MPLLSKLYGSLLDAHISAILLWWAPFPDIPAHTACLTPSLLLTKLDVAGRIALALQSGKREPARVVLEQHINAYRDQATLTAMARKQGEHHHDLGAIPFAARFAHLDAAVQERGRAGCTATISSCARSMQVRCVTLVPPFPDHGIPQSYAPAARPCWRLNLQSGADIGWGSDGPAGPRAKAPQFAGCRDSGHHPWEHHGRCCWLCSAWKPCCTWAALPTGPSALACSCCSRAPACIASRE